MDITQAKEKIVKLLSLAGSDNPNEANAALLAARRLMAQYKLNEKDIKQKGSGKLREAEYKQITYSGIRNTWVTNVGQVIAEHHCCAFINRSNIKSTIRHGVFIGLDDDPEIACTIFDYALDHIKRWGVLRKMELLHSNSDKRAVNEETKNDVANYATGFAKGLKQQYAEQDIRESAETALVLVRPVEVSEYVSSLKTVHLRGKMTANHDIQAKGYNDGYKFNPTRQIRRVEHEALL